MSAISSSVVRACATVLGVAVLGLVPATAASASSTTAPGEELCEAARDHLAEDEPHRAIDLVISARRATGVADLCYDEGLEAAAVVRIASNALARASLEAAEPDPDWDYVQRNARAALAADADNAEASELLEEAESHVGPSELDPREEEAGWTEFREDKVEPVARLLLAGLVIALALLVIARLVARAWPAVPSLSRRVRTLASALGVLGLVGAAASPLWLPGASGGVLAATAAGFLATVVCLAVAMLTRLGLALGVRREDGTPDEAAAAALAASVRRAAADPPRGREVPEGTDVTALARTGISVEGSASPWAGRVRSALGLTPWRVTLHAGPEPRVVVIRDGRSVGAVVVDPAPLGAGGPRVDVDTMAAAFVVTTLSRSHSHGFEPVADVSDWQSLGWTLAAPRITDPEQRRALLAAAVARDPGNLLAQVALHHERDRHDADPRVLEQYARWLEDRADELAAHQGRTALQARLLLTATAVELNRAVLLNPPGRRQRASTPATAQRTASEPGGAREVAQRHAVRLVRLLGGRRLDAGFAARLRPVAAVLTLAAFGAAARTRPSTDPERDLDVWPDHPALSREQQQALQLARQWHADVEGDPEARFVEAGRLFEAARPGSDRRLVTRSLELLADEVERPGGRARMAQDPTLSPLVTSGRFRKRYPAQPCTDLLALEPFVRHAEELRRLALDTPSALWEATEDPDTVAELAAHLRVLPSTVHQLAEAAALAADVPEHLGALRLEVYDALWRCGVRSPDDLRALSPEVLAEAVKQAGAERGLWYATEPDEDQGLREWFASHGATSMRLPAQRSGSGSTRAQTPRP